MMQYIVGILPEILKTLRDLGLFNMRPGLYRKFFEQSNAMFMIVGWRGHIIDVNEELATRIGYAKKSLIGTKFMRYVHPEDQSRAMEQINKIRAGAAVKAFQIRYICSDQDEVVILRWHIIGNGIIYLVATEEE